MTYLFRPEQDPTIARLIREKEEKDRQKSAYLLAFAIFLLVLGLMLLVLLPNATGSPAPLPRRAASQEVMMRVRVIWHGIEYDGFWDWSNQSYVLSREGERQRYCGIFRLRDGYLLTNEYTNNIDNKEPIEFPRPPSYDLGWMYHIKLFRLIPGGKIDGVFVNPGDHTVPSDAKSFSLRRCR